MAAPALALPGSSRVTAWASTTRSVSEPSNRRTKAGASMGLRNTSSRVRVAGSQAGTSAPGSRFTVAWNWRRHA